MVVMDESHFLLVCNVIYKLFIKNLFCRALAKKMLFFKAGS